MGGANTVSKNEYDGIMIYLKIFGQDPISANGR